MKSFVTADWHLGEDRFQLMGRPFNNVDEHIDTLVKNHNSVVRPDDMVYMLGDVCYQKAPEYLSQVSRFNGKKTLVRGNHDKVFTDEQLRPYFDAIYIEGQGFSMEIDGILCYLTHYPTEGLNLHFNLVGHIHAAWKYQLNMFNVGVDANHFFPVDLETIPFHFTAIEKYYDRDVWAAYEEINTVHRRTRGKRTTYFRPDSKPFDIPTIRL